MDLSLTDEQQMIQSTARQFADAELVPTAAKVDRDGDRSGFLARLKQLAELGFMGLNVEAEYGGSEAGSIAFSLAITEVARACASTAVTMSVTNMVGEVIQARGPRPADRPRSVRPESRKSKYPRSPPLG